MKLKARTFTSKDYNMVRQWYWDHGQVAPDLRAFPETSFVIEGVAVGSLIVTNADTGILENFVTNPEVAAKVSSEGIDVLTDILIALGEKLELHQLYVYSEVPSIIKRAKKRGFKQFSKQLTALVGDL